MDPSPTPDRPEGVSRPHQRRGSGETLSTTACIRRARDGDVEALTQVVARMSPLLIAQARLRLGPRLAARIDPEDLVQEAWAVALERMGDLRSRDGRLGPVLFRFLAKTITLRINVYLREAVSEAATGSGGELKARSSASPPGAPAEKTQVVNRTIRAEDARRVQELLDALSGEERSVVVLRGVEGVPNGIAARLLGIAPGTLAKQWERLRARLRETLAPSILDELDE